MSTMQECLQKLFDIVEQVDANTNNIAALDERVTTLEAASIAPAPQPPSPSPAPEPPPSPSPGPSPENPVVAAAKQRAHFVADATIVAPGASGSDIEAALATGPTELGLGDYNGDFTVKDGQILIGIPYGSRINGTITIESGAVCLVRGVLANFQFAPGDAPTRGAIELTVGNIRGTGANLQDFYFFSCDGQHDFQDIRMERVEFARAKSHAPGVVVPGPAVRIHGRSRADVKNLVFDSYNSLSAKDMTFDLRHMEDVTLIGIDDESYEGRTGGPSTNLEDIGIARVMGSGGCAGPQDGIVCTNVDYFTIITQGQKEGGGCVALDIGGAKQAFLIDCSSCTTKDEGGEGRIKQAKNNTMAVSGNVDPALLGDGLPWLGWAREARQEPAVFTPPDNAPDETAAINAMGDYVVLDDRPYRVDGVALTGGRIFRGGPNTVLFSTGGPVLAQDYSAADAQQQSHPRFRPRRHGPGQPTQYGGDQAGPQDAPTTAGAILLDVRLHGGSEGMLFNKANAQCTNMVLSGVTFSGQSNAGIYIHDTYAIDNCHARCVTFEGEACSLLQRGTDDGSGTGPLISYIDKWFWDRPHFYGTRLDLEATRACNLNVWRKGLSEDCAHRIAAGYLYTFFVAHTFDHSTLSDTDMNDMYVVDCDVTLETGDAFGFGTIAEGCSFTLSGDAKPFRSAIPLIWQLYYVNNGAINCFAPFTDPEYVNTPAGVGGVSLFSSMSTWKEGSVWQGPKLRVSSLDTKGTNDMPDDVRTNTNVIY